MDRDTFVNFYKGADMNLKFSDNLWIDLPCFILFFILLMHVSLNSLISVEFGLSSIVGDNPFLTAWIAPIVEESFKFLMLALWTPLAVAFTAIFSVIEAARYITFGFTNFEINPIYYIMRAICIGVHFLTLACQIFGMKMYRKYNMGSYLVLGYMSAIFIHFKWNVQIGAYVVNAVNYYYK